MSKRIIAIDPGEMTGYAIGRILEPGDLLRVNNTGIFVSPEPGGPLYNSPPPDLIELDRKKLLLETYDYLPWKAFSINYGRVMRGDDPFDVVVYESWRLLPQYAKQMIGSDFPPIQNIGAIKQEVWMLPPGRSMLVTSEPKYKDIIDKQMGGTDYLPKRDQVEHYRDAVRHLFWYAINKEGLSPDDCRQAVPA